MSAPAFSAGAGLQAAASTLQGVAPGAVEVLCDGCAPGRLHTCAHRAHHLQASTTGKGRVEACAVYPGIEASFITFLGPQVTLAHPAEPDVLELFYCVAGRVGWNMRGGTAVYLGPGELSLHSRACCADSQMVFPLGYVRGVSFVVDLPALAAECPDILRTAEFDCAAFGARMQGQGPTAMAACTALENIFAPLREASGPLRRAYLQLKSQELLLYLRRTAPDVRRLAQYNAAQARTIRQIHAFLTSHLEQRFTIEELSRRYLVNTSTLKAVFKAVYGQPVAAYMKEYRVHRAMELLAESEESIACVAARMGYESQGKFTRAFKEVAGVLPTEYRKAHQG